MPIAESPYSRLLRLHQPTGIWLLLWPCWWALALASHGNPPLNLLILFGLGAIVMRGAGCIVNDLIDRKIDAQVARTRSRPIASGEISPRAACLVISLLLAVALTIVLQMRPYVLLLAMSSLILVVIYPFMKRITWWPQAFLGLTFNWGALMGFAAVKGYLGLPAFLLYIGCIFWTLGYDTIYAHQDKKDDVLVGVKSTALYLGEHTKYWLIGFYAVAVFFWIWAGYSAYAAPSYYLGMVFIAGHMIWQITSVDLDNPQSCRKTFRSNTTLGWLFFAGTGAINGIYYKLRYLLQP